jgi:hypothetical protein
MSNLNGMELRTRANDLAKAFGHIPECSDLIARAVLEMCEAADEIERLRAAVAAEREACKEVCMEAYKRCMNNDESDLVISIVEAIRARGTT